MTTNASRVTSNPSAAPRGRVSRTETLRASVRARYDAMMAEWDTAPPGTKDQIPLLEEGRSVVSRVFDIVVAGTALGVFSPVMLAVAIIIRLGTPGPILFRQQRIGKNGELFTFVKFRSLYADARQRFPELYAYTWSDDHFKSLVFKTPNDPRITPQGRWLRATSLDELPNLWNVLKGDMALVGPRPDIPEFLQYNRGAMLRRYSVVPGVTGLAHVSGRSNLSVMESVAFDLEYVDRRSFWFDLEIMIRTVLAVLVHRGAF
jgi:lipopolysaccharide/colanic/teichoic acid biosynthesis glycosyltransferase